MRGREEVDPPLLFASGSRGPSKHDGEKDEREAQNSRGTMNGSGSRPLATKNSSRTLVVIASCLIGFAFFCCGGLTGVQANSVRPPPFKRISRPSSLSVHVIRSIDQNRESKRSFDHSSSHSPSSSHKSIKLRRSFRPSELPTAWPIRGEDTLLIRFSLQTPPSTSTSTSFLEGTAEESTPISLILRPAYNLFHPDARIIYHSPPDELTGETSVVRTEPLRLGENGVRVYEGHVLDPWEDWETRWREEGSGVVRDSRDGDEKGWARIVLHPDDGDEGEGDEGLDDRLMFEGAFVHGGVLHHVKTADNYERTRDGLDPEVQFTEKEKRDLSGVRRKRGLVVMKETDVMTAEEHQMALKTRNLQNQLSFADTTSTCSHDSLESNIDPTNPVLQQGALKDPTSLFSHPANRTITFRRELDSPFLQTPGYAYGSDLGKRQSGGDVAGGMNVSGNFIGSIGSTTGCPKDQKVVFLGVAADCTYVSHYATPDAARTQILNNVNSASALYSKSFNVALGVVELSVQSSTCPQSAPADFPWNVGCPEGGASGLDLNTRLSVFSQWRGKKGGGDGAGLWHLMTNCSTGSEVGVAWLGQLCKVSASTGGGSGTTSGTGVTAITKTEWQVVAHEIGHNFGAIHDCASGCSLTGSCCPLTTTTCDAQANFIMSPVSQKTVTSFSQCTIGNICSAMGASLNTSCLATPGQRSVISLQQCGNGILEPGEDCDPGSNTTSTCCDAKTCKFTTGAVCDPTNSGCCTSTCQFAAAQTVCRPAVDSTCDIAETCTGTNATCPADIHVADGTSCGSNGLACASGQCTSRDVQCKAQGATLGITKSCPSNTDSSCSVTCADPKSSSDCIILDNTFIDGTPCGLAGTCSSGQCQNGPFLDAAKSWYTRNLQIAIPVTVVVGLLVILILLAIIRSCARGCMNRRLKNTPPSALYAAQAGLRNAKPGKKGSQRISSTANVPASASARRSSSRRSGPTNEGNQIPRQGNRVSTGSGGRARSDQGHGPPPNNAAQPPYPSYGGPQMSQPPWGAPAYPPPAWGPPSPQRYSPPARAPPRSSWVDPTAYNGPH